MTERDNPSRNNLREELEDRLADQLVRESLSGKKPPEASPVNLAAALAERTSVRGAGTEAPRPAIRPWRTMARYVMAASVLAAVGGIGFLLGQAEERAQAVVMRRQGGIAVAATADSQITLGPTVSPTSTVSPATDPLASTPAESQAVPTFDVPAGIATVTEPVDALAVEPEINRILAPRPLAVSAPGGGALPVLELRGRPHVASSPIGMALPGRPLKTLDGRNVPADAYNVRLAESEGKGEGKVQGQRENLSGRAQAGKTRETDVDARDGLVAKTGESDPLVQYEAARFKHKEQLAQTLARLDRDYREALTKNQPAEAQAKLLQDREAVQAEIRELPVQMPLTGQGEGPQNRGNNFNSITENAFLRVKEHALSTFSIDVDTAAYSITRKYLQEGGLPPAGAVRIEEMVNYFSYDYAGPKGDDPFAAHVEIAGCPWNAAHRLVRVGLKGKEIAPEKRPLTNLVFLLDVSGSMNQPNKLPLVKESMRTLVDRLGENDRVAIAVYAGAAGLVLPSTSADKKTDILNALDNLQAGGSTNGAQGIELAYQTAAEHFIKGGVNRVILCTDGDFNVGTTSNDALDRLIQDKAKTGVFLTVLGFGMGNLQDNRLESLADKGNGNYGYIDAPKEAKKLFVDQLSGTLVTIAKDVKIQIEFNPAVVAGYRLIGYENRILAAQDFNDDKKDAGEIGAGHTVTALYEVTPVDAALPDVAPAIDKLKYQVPGKLTDEAAVGEMMTLKLRYKQPDGDNSKLLEFPVKDEGKKFGQASDDFRFASSVAAFGMLLRRSEHSGNATFAAVAEIAEAALGKDAEGRRAEFVELVKTAKQAWGTSR